MFKIEYKIFHPIEGDSEFKVTLKPLSFLTHSEIRMITAGNETVGVPISEMPIEKRKEREKNDLEFIRLLFERAISKVEGCVCDGAEITTGTALFEIAPAHVVEKIAGEILSLVRPKDDEIKN